MNIDRFGTLALSCNNGWRRNKVLDQAPRVKYSAAFLEYPGVFGVKSSRHYDPAI